MQAKIRAILEKRDPVLWGKLLKLGLYPFGLVYGCVSLARRRLYRDKLLCRNRLPVPVISVGNITAGGTGKTPFVSMLCRLLKEMGKSPAVLLRGYGSSDPEKADEVLLYRMQNPDCGVYPGRDRVRTAMQAIADGYDILVLDDGFQHLRLMRDCDIILVDATCPFGGDMTLPAGLLREFPTSLSEADLIGLTRVDQVSSGTIELVEEKVHKYTDAPVLQCSHRPNRLYRFDNSPVSIASLAGCRVAALSGIGRPDAFVATLRDIGAEVCRCVSFSDHQVYTADMIHEALSTIDRDWPVIVTEKDAVKISGIDMKKEDRERFLVLSIEIRVQGLRQLRDKLQSVLTNFPRIS